MNVIFMVDNVLKERQHALILVAGDDEAFDHWNALEDQVEGPTKLDQVWDALEMRFKQLNSHWHYHDLYLGHFRLVASETMAGLNRCIRESIKGCKFKKEEEEGYKINFP